jgi:uncharacterized protein (DUF362 family)
MSDREHRLSRRQFLRAAWKTTRVGAAGALLSACGARLGTPTGEGETVPPVTPWAPRSSDTPSGPPTPNPTATTTPTPGGPSMGRVSLVVTQNRAEGTRRVIDLLGEVPLTGKRVLLKPNFNSSDPAPGSTHNDVLRSMVEWLQEGGAGSITVADRSGMGDTRRLMRDKGVLAMADELGFEPLVLDELGPGDWEHIRADDSHWRDGFFIARPCLDADVVVQTCCLKTHRFGGHFTLSLKNSVGLVAKAVPGDAYNFMNELHSSSQQRRMIAEVNTAYAPSMVVLDGVQAFVNGGPDQGKKVAPHVMLAGSDRVALDAVGVALLRMYGTTPDVASGPIFELEQIARAVELGLGAPDADAIEIVTGDAESQGMAEKVRGVLLS